MSVYPVRKLTASALFACCFLFLPAYVQALEIPLQVTESAGYARRAEAVTLGVPMPRGAVSDLSRLTVLDPGGKAVAAQFETSSTRTARVSGCWWILSLNAMPTPLPAID